MCGYRRKFCMSDLLLCITKRTLDTLEVVFKIGLHPFNICLEKVVRNMPYNIELIIVFASEK